MTITLTREEAQQVLDALEMYLTMETHDEAHILEVDIAPKAIELLRARLAQPEPELWGCKFNKGKRVDTFYTKSAAERYVEGASRNGADVSLVGLYTAPPQREWQGLTDEEIFAVAKAEGQKLALKKNPTIDLDFARAIEAKLKEKNG